MEPTIDRIAKEKKPRGFWDVKISDPKELDQSLFTGSGRKFGVIRMAIEKLEINKMITVESVDVENARAICDYANKKLKKKFIVSKLTETSCVIGRVE